MPYIRICLSKPFTQEQSSQAAEGLGKNISLLKDKDESKLMLDFSHSEHMFFRGKPLHDGCYAECRLLGPQTYESKKDFTEAVFKVFEEAFGVQQSEMFMTFAHYDDWGTAGSLKRL